MGLDITLGIYPDNDFLSTSIENKFKDKYVDVVYFHKINEIDFKNLNYLIINLTNNNFILTQSEIEKTCSLIDRSTCKNIVILPQYVSGKYINEVNKFIKQIVSINKSLTVILSPVLLGTGVKYSDGVPVYDLVLQSSVSDRIKIKNDGRLINMISLSKFSDRVVKETFSFGTLGKTVLVVGERRMIKTVATKYLKLKEENVLATQGTYDLSEVESDLSVKIEFSLHKAIKNTKDEFVKNTKTIIVEELKVEPNQAKKEDKRPNFKYLYKFVIPIILILLTPLFLVMASATLIFASSKLEKKNINLSESLLKKSVFLSKLSGGLSLGNKFYFDTSNFVQKTADLGLESISLLKTLQEFSNYVVGKDLYSINTYTDNISGSLDKIHTNLSFLQTDIQDFRSFDFLKLEISKVKTKIYNFRSIASRLSFLLGGDKPMKYLVIFQNNMELRPTGGFIGSYAMATFDKGRLTEINISDIYSADGQLKGHVDPPEPIRQYLGEGGWAMRDSNWEPDFVKASSKIEWFLDKEVNDKVDGVIAIDLNLIKDLLDITGPINLVDFNKTITSTNLYTETQSEVESNFFPGSIKKASFLTSLAKNLIYDVENLDKSKKQELFKVIYKNFEERHVQMYLHDKNSQIALSNLDFSGEINMNTDCGPRCYRDSYSLIDANLGVNKANLFISRDQVVNISLFRDRVEHELTVKYDNKAGVASGNTATYKTYTRLIVPDNAKVVGLRLYDSDGKYTDLKYDDLNDDGVKSIGFLIEVMPNNQKLVQIVWTSETDRLSGGGEYNLAVRKQAGTDKDNLKIIMRTNGLTLTGKAVPVYNTNLIRDFKTKLFLSKI